MPDYAAQRFNMVESQVRTCDVPDMRIQNAMLNVPRERFVPALKRALAYAETQLEVVPGRFMLEPRSLAKLIQLAGVRDSDHVLVVGCLTGYSAAVLARIAAKVTALESDVDLVRAASEALPAVGAVKVTVVQGALKDGAKQMGPFDVILLDGGVEEVPEALFGQLAEDGRLVTVLAPKGGQGQSMLYRRNGAHIGRLPGFDASAPILPGFKKPAAFVF